MATKINTPVPYSEYATLSVTTDLVAPYKYQWKRNGENLVHGNNKSYTTPPLRPEDFKAKYSVQVFGQDKIESSDEVVINDKLVFPEPITNKATPAKNITVIPPVKYAGPERRSSSSVGVPPKGMAERRVTPARTPYSGVLPNPVPHVPERRNPSSSGLPPTGMAERRGKPAKQIVTPVHPAVSGYISTPGHVPERRIHAGVSPTGVERRIA